MNCGRVSTRADCASVWCAVFFMFVRLRVAADERGLAAIRRLRNVQDDGPRLTLAEFKALVRDQYYMSLIDQTATLAAIPVLMPGALQVRGNAFVALCQVLDATEEPPAKLR